MKILIILASLVLASCGSESGEGVEGTIYKGQCIDSSGSSIPVEVNARVWDSVIKIRSISPLRFVSNGSNSFDIEKEDATFDGSTYYLSWKIENQMDISGFEFKKGSYLKVNVNKGVESLDCSNGLQAQ